MQSKDIWGKMDFSFLFDDVVKDEYGTWSQVCREHAGNFDILALGKLENSPSGNIICGCNNCKNKADYYIDFYNKK